MGNKGNLTLPPSAEQMKTINCLISDDRSAMIYNTYQYIMQNSVDRHRVTSNCIIGFTVGTVGVFALLGSASPKSTTQSSSDKSASNQKSSNEPQNEQQMQGAVQQNGAFWGRIGLCLFGGICTGLVSYFWTSRSIVLSQDYIGWRYRAIINNVFNPYQEFLKSSKLDRFLCAITLDLPAIAVKDPDSDQWYEYSAIAEQIETANERRNAEIRRQPTAELREKKRKDLETITSPIRTRDLKLTDLKFDINFYVEVSKVIVEILKTDLEKQHREGLLSYCNNIKMNNDELSKAVREELYQKLKDGLITDTDYMKAINACRQYYDKITPLENHVSSTIMAQ
jgi:hypothetical protein